MSRNDSGAQIQLIAGRALLLVPGGRIEMPFEEEGVAEVVRQIKAAIVEQHHHGAALFPALSAPADLNVHAVRSPNSCRIVVERADPTAAGGSARATGAWPSGHGSGARRSPSAPARPLLGRTPMRVSAQTSTSGGIPVLRLADELDLSEQSDFGAIVTAFETEGDCLVVDLRDVSYMDSSSLGVLIGMHVRVAERGGVMAIAHGSAGLGRLFEVAGLRRTFHTFESLDEATAYIAKSCRSSSQ